ncbi:uncharacterized protein EAF02_001588 [Botrytis sinoallii]|uniref:uncharacterized protein n=1 Tax=Botrytis sinoallii TaxID=1463999 RepID=UPI0019022FDF|nr:uncharacterized protein EAF02_001588 [Botrytis sinoallii]KAF7891263.1 hypothetical protein EAF02_001588 [Botrytis sinoallii]
MPLPRVLYFSGRQLFWECAELQASESSPFEIPRKEAANFKTLSPCQHQDQNLTDLNSEIETLSQERQRFDDAFEIWGSVISAYTMGKLSKGSDKLIAISAIARELQPLWRCRYLAGLWEAHLVLQLAWRSYDSVIPLMVYRAPSWSWASIDGVVQFPDLVISNLYSPLVEILEVVIDLVGEDEFGQVQGGHLNLLGQMINLGVLDEEKKSGQNRVLFNGKLNFAMILENEANIRTKFSTNQLICLPLHLQFFGRLLIINSLILECVDVTNNEYRRVGLLEYSKSIPVENGHHTRKVSIEDPFLSTLGDIEQTGDDSLVFKRGSADLREITII